MRFSPALGVLLVGSCTLFEKEPEPPATTSPTLTTTYELPPGFLEGQFCTVRTVFELACVTGCHSSVVPEAGLDLHTDPYYSIVYQPSQQGGGTLVVPRKPEESYLYLKMQGLQGYGEVMPPQGVMDDYFLRPVRDWILAGAPFDCEPGYIEDTFTGTGPYHPPGWEASDVHGLAAKIQTDGDCRSCHGALLDGGTAGVSCDDCHAPDWRTDCTYCHGGTLNTTGAPPRDMDGEANPDLISFTSHDEHVAGYDHLTYGCDQCHYKPADVLTPGHVFDDVTAGYGELDYTAGLAPVATYYQGTCSNVYCHGDGYNTLGTATDGQGGMACYSCHPDQTSDPNVWNNMSGRHKQHLDTQIYCSECHSQVVDLNQSVLQPQYHVDGYVQVLPIGTTWINETCDGECHGHNHVANTW